MSDFRIKRDTAEQGPAFRLRLIRGTRSESESRSPLLPKAMIINLSIFDGHDKPSAGNQSSFSRKTMQISSLGFLA
jgi:hypothetical protein